MASSIYLDYNATTPVDERVVQRMLPFFTQYYGNPANTVHPFGWAASEAVEAARESVARCIRAKASEVIFTSGATEAINAALKGVARAYRRKGLHIVTVDTEHSAVRTTCRSLEKDGYEVTFLPVDQQGAVDLEELERALRADTVLVSMMWANNETGVLHPIRDIARTVRARGILFMTDATQAIGKVPVTVDGIDIMVCSGHKVYGPKGVGALYLRERNPRVRVAPLLEGGGQERGLRGGTLNVPGIVGMGAAFDIARVEQPRDAERLSRLRDNLETTLERRLPDICVNGSEVPRLPQTSSITFGGVNASTLLAALRNVALSAGSACAAGSSKPSHVLRAMGLAREDAAATLRISLGRPTTQDEVGFATREIILAVQSLREEPTYA